MKETFNDKAKDADHLQWGSFIHKVFELGTEEVSVSGLTVIAESQKSNYTFKDNRWKQLPKLLKNFLAFNNQVKKNTISLEYRFEVDLKCPKGEKVVTMNGIIDRVLRGESGDHYLVIDYKTSKREKSAAELIKDKQMIMYAQVISHQYKVPLRNIRVAHFYPVTGNLVSVPISEGVSGASQRELISDIWKIRKMKTKDFKPRMNQFCNWCDYKGLCPLFEKPSLINERLDLIKENQRVLKEIEKEKKNPKS